MVRTQVQLTEHQVRALRQLAVQKKRSLADLVRESVELFLAQESQPDKALRVQRALQAAGRFSSGEASGSSEHDRHLSEAYRE
jgi:Arc/MetJ-type ribon-helix-helix transcriptional regulator